MLIENIVTCYRFLGTAKLKCNKATPSNDNLVSSVHLFGIMYTFRLSHVLFWLNGEFLLVGIMSVRENLKQFNYSSLKKPVLKIWP